MTRTAASATGSELGLPRTAATNCSGTRLGVMSNEPIPSTAAARASMGSLVSRAKPSRDAAIPPVALAAAMTIPWTRSSGLLMTSPMSRTIAGRLRPRPARSRADEPASRTARSPHRIVHSPHQVREQVQRRPGPSSARGCRHRPAGVRSSAGTGRRVPAREGLPGSAAATPVPATCSGRRRQLGRPGTIYASLRSPGNTAAAPPWSPCPIGRGPGRRRVCRRTGVPGNCRPLLQRQAQGLEVPIGPGRPMRQPACGVRCRPCPSIHCGCQDQLAADARIRVIGHRQQFLEVHLGRSRRRLGSIESELHVPIVEAVAAEHADGELTEPCVRIP